MNVNMPRLSVGLTGLLLVWGLVAGCDSTDKTTSSETSNAATSPSATAQPASAGEASPEPASAAQDDRYDVRSPNAPVKVGQKHKVELAITPGDGLKINKEFPWKLEFSAPEGVQIAQSKVAGAQIDLAESQATIPLYLEASAAGEHQLDATGDFSVCNDTKCWVIRDQPLSFKLEADSVAADPAQQAPAQPATQDE